MGRSIFFKLLGAFTLVIAVLAVVTTILANKAASGEFETYTDRNSEAWAEYLAPALAEYYATHGTWDGVSSILQALPVGSTPPATSFSPTIIPTPVWPTPIPTSAQSGSGMGRGGMGHGMGMGMGSNGAATAVPMPGMGGAGISPTEPSGRGMGSGMRGSQWNGGSGSSDIWSMMGHRIIIADANGNVVSDSSGQPDGTVLSNEQVAEGQPIEVGGQSAGTVLIEPQIKVPGTPAGEFLRAMNRSILAAVFAAAAVALILGGVLFFQITAPLRKLKAAASAIAAGDLTQRVQVQSRDELGDLAVTFNAMAETLSRAETHRRQMVADVAHELRTPLSVMQANLEAMQDGVLPLDSAEIATLHEETILLTRLVADLHLLSMAEAGQLRLDRDEVDPGELIRKAAERLAQNALERAVTIKIETAGALPSVSVDGDRIQQVLGNLISNALRYTQPGGIITVRAEPARKHSGSILVSVTDTGCGIPKEELTHIFDRFYRADKSRNRGSGGSGLGLAITKHIVEAHGGDVWAESPVWLDAPPECCGTRISFTLPSA